MIAFFVLTNDGVNGFFMDCPQLEKTLTPSRYNLINNGDFRYSADTDYGWTTVNCAAADGVAYQAVSPAAQLDNNAFVLNGDTSSTKRVTQRIAVSGYADDFFTLCGWARGNSVPLENYNESTSGAREYALRCTINYSDGTTSDPFIARFNPDIDGWQYSAVQIQAKKHFTSMDVELVCDYLADAVCFDGIQLYREVSASSATYHDDGNLKTVTDAYGRVTSYTYYAGTKDVHQVSLDGAVKMTYEYDSCHNVTKTTDDEGVITTYTYDTYGNNTSVSVQSGSTTSASTFVYTADGNRLMSSTDALGKTTVYDYDANTNVLNWVQNPGDTETTRTHYSYDAMYRPTNVGTTTNTGLSLSAAYTYSEDYLTAIQTASTRYSFTYGDFGLRQSVSAGSNTLAAYSYTNDQNKYLSKVSYGNGDSVSYEYDSEGRVIKQTYEDGAYVTFIYGSSGALASSYDSETGITTSYTYDYAGRLQRYDEKADGYSYSLYNSYNDKGQLQATCENTDTNNNGIDRWSSIGYDSDDRLIHFHKDCSTRNYTYDALGRVSKTTLAHQHSYSDPAETPFLDTIYTYNGNTGQITVVRHSSDYYNKTYSYSYDANGNILSVSDGTNTTSYVYDSANQLIRENNQAGGFTHTWTYDNAGNILSRTEYAYTTGELGTPTKTVSYTYGDSQWGDLLTGYDGQAFTYDEIGNLTNDGTWTYTWKHGRELTSMVRGTATWNYTYNAGGMRTFRTNNNGKTYRYVYNGGELDYLRLTEKDANGNLVDYVMRFNHTPEGKPLSIIYGGTAYYYITNLQGDVVALVDKYGEKVVEYTYDAWGKLLSTSGSMANTLGKRNPLRYRGYVYDTETGLYYLQSRYYNPNTGRFINADGLVATGQGVLGNTMFAYCLNNPVNYIDENGEHPGVLGGWAAGMGWLPLADTILPVGDIIYFGGMLLLGVIVQSSSQNSAPEIMFDNTDVSYGYSSFVPPLTTFGIDSLRTETVAIKKRIWNENQIASKVEALAISQAKSENPQYFAAYLNSGQVVPYLPLTYSDARIWVSAGGDLLCTNHAAAYAITRFYPSARWDGRHGCLQSGFLNHYHLSSAHDNHIWYLGE